MRRWLSHANIFRVSESAQGAKGEGGGRVGDLAENKGFLVERFPCGGVSCLRGSLWRGFLVEGFPAGEVSMWRGFMLETNGPEM